MIESPSLIISATSDEISLLLFDALVHAFFERRFGFLLLAQHDAAMHLLDQSLAHQRLDVAANGFVGYLELRGQFDDRAGAA